MSATRRKTYLRGDGCVDVLSDDDVDHMVSGDNGIVDVLSDKNVEHAMDTEFDDHNQGPLIRPGSSTSVKPTTQPSSSLRHHVQGSTSSHTKRGRSDSTPQSGKKYFRWS